MQGELKPIPLIFPLFVTIIGITLGLIIATVIIRSSILRNGFFAKQQKYELLAGYLYDQDFLIKKKPRNRKGKEKCKFPKVYYKAGTDTDQFTFRIGNKFHDKFLGMGKPLEEIYLADLVEIKRIPQHVTFKLLIDTISKRVNFLDVKVKEGKITLMEGVEWDFEKLAHMLITGGTGGGKTYFIYTLIAVLGKIGRVHVCDPKKSDLSDLEDFPIFKGLVASDTEDIVRTLKEAVELMDKRYHYMKHHKDNRMGKNYRYYKMPPEFFIIDEWGAFVSALPVTKEMELYQTIAPLVLKARQAGVFLIISTQKAGTDVIRSMIRDNLMCKVSLGSLSAGGYLMTFGQDNKDKPFFNKPKAIGRGYIDVGNGIPQEFYAPYINKDFNFEEYFKEMKPMPYLEELEEKQPEPPPEPEKQKMSREESKDYYSKKELTNEERIKELNKKIGRE